MMSRHNNPRALWVFLMLIAASTFTAAAKDYIIKVVNSAGEPQRGMILHFTTREYFANDEGVIEFTYNGKTVPTVQLFFPDDKSNAVKRFQMDELEEGQMRTFRIDSKADLARYKSNGMTMPVEGQVVDERDRPIEGAGVGILGTERKTATDEVGLFQIDADFGHPIVIRATGKENRTLSIGAFLDNPDDALTITMYAKDTAKVYSSAEHMPEFRGGMKAFWAYLDNNLRYPEKAKAAGKEGVVVVQFIVERSGAITGATVMRKLNPEMDAAALEVIESMPDWIPAREKGKIIRCKYAVPVKFSIPKPKPKPAIIPQGPMIEPMRQLPADSLIAPADSLALPADSIIAPTDSLAEPVDSLSVNVDSLRVIGDSIKAQLGDITLPFDSLGVPRDSLAAPADSLALPVDTLKKGDMPPPAKGKKEKKRKKKPKKEEEQT